MLVSSIDPRGEYHGGIPRGGDTGVNDFRVVTQGMCVVQPRARLICCIITSIINLKLYVLLTKTTAAQNEAALSYDRVRGLYFLAVVFVRRIIIIIFKRIECKIKYLYAQCYALIHITRVNDTPP